MLRLVPFAAILALSACMGGETVSFDGTYQLTSIDGAAIPGSADLTIEGQAVNGQGPCNRYMGTNAADWPEVSLGAVASTRRACVIEGGEAAFLKAMGQVTRAERSGDNLALIGPDHRLEFTVQK